jgi:Tol biopolymer transport system component
MASGNGPSELPVISPDGRFVAFVSRASDLVANDTNDTNGQFDVFVRDLQTGTTTLVGINQAGTATSNRGSFGPLAISADGRFVAFHSGSSDLVATDTNEAVDVFVRDLQAGITTLVSVNSAGTDSGKGIDPFFGGPLGSSNPTLCSNGRFVAFESSASDLVETDTNRESDVFVRDIQTGVTTLVSINSTGTDSGKPGSGKPGTRGSFQPVLSSDGRFVAFESDAIDLVPNDTNGQKDVFVRDLQTGTTALVSINQAGTTSGNGVSANPRISADGRFVAFVSQASDLVANDTNGEADVFVRDLQTGTTILVSVNQAGTATGNDRSSYPVISADGHFVAFVSRASDLVTNDHNDRSDVFVRSVP